LKTTSSFGGSRLSAAYHFGMLGWAPVGCLVGPAKRVAAR
jgi:hypothetical protein